MVTGVGIGGDMAFNGVAAHAVTHIIYKALLLMSAGSVLYMTGKRKCTDLGGLFQSMPVTTVCGIIGALSISSVPLTSGFISKSMISQAAADEYLVIVWFLLAAASAGVFLHAGIKFPWFVFFQKDSGLRPPDPPLNMRLAMILFAALCIGIGVWPEPLYNILPRPVDYVPYTWPHVVEMLQLLLFSALAFFLMLPLMKRTLTITLDVDWFYRRLGARLVRGILALGAPIDAGARRAALHRLDRFIAGVFRHHGPDGAMARTWPTGSTVLLVTLLLGIYLLVYYA
jgi:multicomponent Na+:H+ antiporter subunit D